MKSFLKLEQEVTLHLHMKEVKAEASGSQEVYNCLCPAFNDNEIITFSIHPEHTALENSKDFSNTTTAV
jgi:hypothetical protein